MSAVRALTRTALGLALAGQLLGCALTSKSDSIVLRYFSPDAVHARTTGAENRGLANNANLALRLGRVNAATYLKDKIAYRDSAYEVGYYDELRWTEKPEAYLRRALRGSFFEEQRVRQTVSGQGPTLDVELNAFEEIKTPRRAGRVGVTWILRDDQVVLAQETFIVERAFASNKGADESPAAFTAAMAEALDETVKRVVSRVLEAMAPPPADATTPPRPLSR